MWQCWEMWGAIRRNTSGNHWSREVLRCGWWVRRRGKWAAENQLLVLASVGASLPGLPPMSHWPRRCWALRGLSRASSGAGPGGGRVLRVAAVRTRGSSQRLAPPGEGGGKLGLSGGRTGCLAEGWVKNAENQPPRAPGNCSCHPKSGTGGSGTGRF